MAEKIRLLFLAANPVDTSYRLRLDEEIREISREMRASPGGYLFEICCEWAVRPNDLQEALVIYRPHIVHLSGHATRSKGIMLEDDSGKICPISVEALVDLFRILRGNIRIVFLNLCYTERHIELLSEMIDYTLGIRTKIEDKGAIIFSSSFYKGLALGLSVKTSFELAINQLMLRHIRFSKSPLLRVREGVNESESFVALSNQSTTTPILTGFIKSHLGSEITATALEATRDAEFDSPSQKKEKKFKKDKKKKRGKKK
jgi:hypothetical protein